MVGFLIENLITKRRWEGEVKKSHVLTCVAAATTALHTICFPSVTMRCNWTWFSISGHQLCCMICFHAQHLRERSMKQGTHSTALFAEISLLSGNSWLLGVTTGGSSWITQASSKAGSRRTGNVWLNSWSIAPRPLELSFHLVLIYLSHCIHCRFSRLGTAFSLQSVYLPLCGRHLKHL